MRDELMIKRDAYLEIRKCCRALGQLNRDSNTEAIEQARQKTAAASWKLWEDIEEQIIVEWCNATDTPRSPLHLYPPKDMATNNNS